MKYPPTLRFLCWAVRLLLLTYLLSLSTSLNSVRDSEGLVGVWSGWCVAGEPDYAAPPSVEKPMGDTDEASDSYSWDQFSTQTNWGSDDEEQILLEVESGNGHEERPTEELESAPALQDLEPALWSWPQLQQQIARARCATRVYRYLHPTPRSRRSTSGVAGNGSTVSSSSRSVSAEARLPDICRRPIAIIVTEKNPVSCRSCTAFAKQLLSPEHRMTLEALRDAQVSMAVHYSSNGGDGVEDSEGTLGGAPGSLSELLYRHPIASVVEEDLDTLFRAEDPNPASTSSKSLLVVGRHRYTAGQVAAGRRAVSEHWERLRRHPAFLDGWKQAYAGEGDYSLRILFLWPHNGSVMPIVSPDWSLYVRMADAEAEAAKHPEQPTRPPPPSDSVSHWYVSPVDFFRNCITASEMMARLLRSQEI